MELVKSNLLWLICCLPIFTIGAATTAMNLLPLLLLLFLPQAFFFAGFLLILCGFSLMALYDITVIEKIFIQFR